MAKRNKNKTPKVGVVPAPIKQPKKASEPEFRGGLLSWRFAKADNAGPFAWSNLSDEIYREVLEKLHSYEGMSHNEIDNSGSHTISISKLSKEAQDRLTEIKLDDLDEIMSFRMNGKARVICRPSGSLMRVLWWDPEHQVCPAPKKHT